MPNELNIKLEIQSVLRDKGLIDAKARVEALEKEVGSLTKELDKSAGSTRSMVAEFAKFAAGAAVIAFARGAATAFADLERQWSATAFVMRNMGLDADKILPKVRAELEQIAMSGGPLEKETLPAFNKFIGITRNTGAALEATRLAANVSEAGFVDMAGATEAVTALLQGKAKSAAEVFHLSLFKLNGEQKTHVELLNEAIKAYDGLSASMNDSKDSLDRSAAAWDSVSRRLGQIFVKVVEPATRLFSFIFNQLVYFSEREAEVIKVTGERLAHLFDVKSLASNAGAWWAEFDNITARSLQRWADTQVRLSKDAARLVVDEHKKLAVDLIAEDDARIAAQAALRKQAALADLKAEKEAADAALAEKERIQSKLKQEEEQALKDDQERAKARMDLAQATVKAQIDAARDGSEEKMRLELQYLDMQEREAKAKYANIKGAEVKIEEQFQIARMALVKRYNEQAFLEELQRYKDLKDAESEYQRAVLEGRVQDAANAYNRDIKGEFDAKRDQRKLEFDNRERDLANAVIKETSIQGKSDADRAAAWKKYDTLRKANQQSYNNDVKNLNREEMKANEEKYINLTTMALNALGQIFGDNKGLAVASALVNTYEAATKALAEGGPYLGPILAALMIAAGMAQVQKIMDTEPTTARGFDDPVNDAYARQFGGRKWARDLVNQIGMGFRDELPLLSPFSGGPGSVTNNSESYTRHGDVYNFHGLLIDDRNLKQAARLVRRGERLDQARRPR